MNKNLTGKFLSIVVLTALALWILYPPQQTLKAGIDLNGGTSLIYGIDIEGIAPKDQKGLSNQMIEIIRRRVDPQQVMNLIWRPIGNTRFEIQQPLASPDTIAKRQNYQDALANLTADNLNNTIIMKHLDTVQEKRNEIFADIAGQSEKKKEILNSLANAYDAKKSLEDKTLKISQAITLAEENIKTLDIDIRQIKSNWVQWSKLSAQMLTTEITAFLNADPNNPKTEQIKMVTDYINSFNEYNDTDKSLNDPNTGAADIYLAAEKQLGEYNISEEQITNILDNKQKRKKELPKLIENYPLKEEKINALVKAFDEYKPYRGRLDDPEDLKRMLKGAGILEFRILPTMGDPDFDSDKLADLKEKLESKGPKYASDNEFKWFPIEKKDGWITTYQGQEYIAITDRTENANPAVLGKFADKWYVLASNRTGETMLNNPQVPWQLTKAYPARDSANRRAIGFTLDQKAGQLFAALTRKNLKRPLCTLLDDIAISAPSINDVIFTSGIITGDYPEVKQAEMINKLNAGRLPARLIEVPLSEKTIGPMMGAANRDKGIQAGFYGLVLVLVIMLVYYSYAGAIANIALVLNILFVLAIMVFLRATFTLPGIAGIILTIGMTVDANVLIFERIREELQKGSSLAIAVKNGYQKAFRTIVDANLTTIITAAILYWVASEEIKGFAIVLMLGIGSSMFTALYATRVIFDMLIAAKVIKDKIPMMSIVKNPTIDWMKYSKIFITISLILVISGLTIFFTRDEATNSKYDIEFTGGTSAVPTFKEGVNYTRTQVQQKIQDMATEMDNPALMLATVQSIGQPAGTNDAGEEFFLQYEINTTATNISTLKVKLPAASAMDADDIETALVSKLNNLNVTLIAKGEYEIATSLTNAALLKSTVSSIIKDAVVSDPNVQQTVTNAILKAFGEDLDLQQNLTPNITSTVKIDRNVITQYPQITDFQGGIMIKCALTKATSAKDIKDRIHQLQFKPDFKNIKRYDYKIFKDDMTETTDNERIASFVYISLNDEFAFTQPSPTDWDIYTQNETDKINNSMQLAESLRRVTQIDPSIGDEAKISALIAIILSLFAIVTYIWIRFGDYRYGFAAILALVHDVSITLGAITVCTYIFDGPIGKALLIGDFKINLAIIAAFLTLIGYSLNDTIVIFDRIRENRRKAQLNPQTITNSINQTLSRTLMTSITTFAVILIMYIFGGPALRGFTFAIGIGVIVGTYSSIAIAAPVLLIGKKFGQTQSKKK